jgi:DNA mismatch endonuclease (patch repair protein)
MDDSSQRTLRFDSALEVEVFEGLSRAGFDVVRGSRKIWGNPDFVLVGKRTAIFVHGCYWHRHANCPRGKAHPVANASQWAARFSATVERDARNRRTLRAAGWNVVVLWECTIQQEPGRVPEAIARAAAAPQNECSVGTLVVA